MSEQNRYRIPPHSTDAERSVLSAILSRPGNLDIALQTLTKGDFYHINHQHIFGAMMALSLDGISIDLVTLTDQLKASKQLGESGGASYLAEIQDEFISDAYIADHVRIVKDKSILRALIIVTSTVTHRCYNEEGNIPDFARSLEEEVLKAIAKNMEKTILSAAEAMPKVTEFFDYVQKNKGEMTGVPSGFLDLDKITNGFQRKDLIILAARPSVGKTAFAMNVASFCAEKGKPVGVFSLEMGTTQLFLRMLATKSRVPSDRIQSGNLSDNDFGRIANGLGLLVSLPIFVDDVSAQTLVELRAKARVMKRDHNIQLLIIDYLQLMQSGERAENRNLEVGQITRRLKLVAKELDIPILLLSQLNRDLERRGDKRPGLADLRDSGSIEQDADIVMFLYREAVYAETVENVRQAELIIGKNRNGKTGIVNLVWNPEITQFANATKTEAPIEWTREERQRDEELH